MGVNWDRRSIEFRLLFFKYNKNLYYVANTQQLQTSYLSTLASASADASIADKVSERLRKLQDYQTNIIDGIMYGMVKKQQQKVEADRQAIKIDFLKTIGKLQFKG